MTDRHWDNVAACLAEVSTASTVDDVIAALQRRPLSDHETPSGDPDVAAQISDACDEDLCSTLTAAGWKISFIEGDYWYVATNKAGESLTYCEGDVYRGRPA